MQKWYWCGQSTNVVSVDDSGEEVRDYGDAAAFFEPTASDRDIGIKICNLTKVFTKRLYILIYLSRTNMFLCLLSA